MEFSFNETVIGFLLACSPRGSVNRVSSWMVLMLLKDVDEATKTGNHKNCSATASIRD